VSISTHHETNEEFENVGLLLGHGDGSIPENKCEDEENERPSERVESIAPNS
jgi:hypothetical protein